MNESELSVKKKKKILNLLLEGVILINQTEKKKLYF